MRGVSGAVRPSMSEKPTIAMTPPEKRVRLSGFSVCVRTRDQTMLVEKQATQIMQARKPIQSAWREPPQGWTAMTTPLKPARMARAFFSVMRSWRRIGESRATTIGARKMRM